MSQKTQKQIIKILPDCQIKSELLQITAAAPLDEEMIHVVNSFQNVFLPGIL
jgi:hypothetical protein